VLGSGSSAGAFRGGGGLRGGAGGDSDDEDDGGQRIGFEEGAISFDQVSPMLWSSLEEGKEAGEKTSLS